MSLVLSMNSLWCHKGRRGCCCSPPQNAKAVNQRHCNWIELPEIKWKMEVMSLDCGSSNDSVPFRLFFPPDKVWQWSTNGQKTSDFKERITLVKSSRRRRNSGWPWKKKDKKKGAIKVLRPTKHLIIWLLHLLAVTRHKGGNDHRSFSFFFILPNPTMTREGLEVYFLPQIWINQRGFAHAYEGITILIRASLTCESKGRPSRGLCSSKRPF